MLTRRAWLAAAGAAAAAKAARASPAPGEQASRTVATADELAAAAQDAGVATILVAGRLTGVPSVRLQPGQQLLGRGGAEVEFAAGSDGLCLTSGNAVAGLALRASPERRALFNDTSVPSLGEIRLRRLLVTGQVQLLARDAVRGGRVQADAVQVEAADMRDRPDRPEGFGVGVLQGAFTLWNQWDDPAVTIEADLSGISAGRDGHPVLGSGLVVSGARPGGGGIKAVRIEAESLYSDGRLPPGTHDRIAAALFVGFGVEAASVRNSGPATTYGVNDMVLDNWGAVDEWVALGPVTSFGASGSAVVTFGRLSRLRVEAEIETHGLGARGFNIYVGSCGSAEFERIVTHGDGAVGIQVGQPMDRIEVRRGIETFGGRGQSLVRGALVQLAATALSVTPSGAAREVRIRGGLSTHASGILPFEILGTVDALDIGGGIGNRVLPGAGEPGQAETSSR